jgi:hypothetical protein
MEYPSMSDKIKTDLPFTSDEPAENTLWNSLATIEAEQPSANLRKNFYAKLDRATAPTLSSKLRDFLGFSGYAGWITATACLLVGLGTGQLIGTDSSDSSAERLATLEQNVSMLNRTLILDRLDNDSAGKRLQGVLDAAYFASEDAEIAAALLQRAMQDRVHSVRAAAIDALGRQLGAPSVGKRIMDSIAESESPIVQLALIDVVLRNGNQQQLDELLRFAQDGVLHPDLAQHVLASLKRDVV